MSFNKLQNMTCSCSYIAISIILRLAVLLNIYSLSSSRHYTKYFNNKDMQLYLYSYAHEHSVISLVAEFDLQLQLYTHYHYFETGSTTEYISSLCSSLLWIHKAVVVIQSQL